MTATEQVRGNPANGAAMAAILASGIGAFALGVLAILNETKMFATPTIYKPAGGISGRTTVAVVVWLVAWAVLHNRWRDREIPSRQIHRVTLVLMVVSLVLTFPPLWPLL